MDSERPVAARLRAAGVNLAVVLAAVASVLAAGEIGLRVAGVRVWPADGRARWVADAQLLVRGDPAFPEHDARGFRNPEALERADVVLLGDSNTYGDRVSPDDTWARVLAEEAGRVVYNMGFPGWGPRQAALVLPDALALKPQAVLHGFFFGNDFLNALETAVPVGATTSSGAAATGAPPSLPCREYLTPASGVRAFAGRHSRTYGLLRNFYRTVVPYADLVDDAEAVRRRADRDPHDEVTFFAGAQWQTAFDAPYRFCALDDADPRIRAGVDLARTTLLAMARDAEDAGAAFAVVFFPTKELVFAPRVADFGAHEGLAGLVAAESRLRRELAAVLRANGVPVLDLLPPLRGAGEQPYPVGGRHPNVTGSRVIGRQAARFVRELGCRPARPCGPGRTAERSRFSVAPRFIAPAERW